MACIKFEINAALKEALAKKPRQIPKAGDVPIHTQTKRSKWASKVFLKRAVTKHVGRKMKRTREENHDAAAPKHRKTILDMLTKGVKAQQEQPNFKSEFTTVPKIGNAIIYFKQIASGSSCQREPWVYKPSATASANAMSGQRYL